MRPVVLFAAILLLVPVLAGCVAPDDPSAGQTPDQDTIDDDSVYQIPPGTGGMSDEERIGLQSQEIIFGGSLKHSLTRVLLIPPAHGDLGDPIDGPTFEEYLDVTLKGIYEWLVAIERFVEDHPEYDYLLEIDIEVDIFDERTSTPSVIGYDIIAAYVETGGPAFRGLASSLPPDTQAILNDAGLGDLIHYANRYMVMSLFSSAPRAGQEVPDYPELNDLEVVTMHEFAHVWGIGHTTTFTEEYGPDLMNSPYAWVYGDGDPLGDGGIRTPLSCISSLNLYALAMVYAWLPEGEWEGSGGEVELPEGMEYKLYCRDGTYNQANVGLEDSAA